MAANLIKRARHRRAEGALAAAPRDRRAPRLPLALGARRRERHRATRVPGRAATATSTSINGTKMWVTNGERAGIVALAAAHRRGHHLLHRREGARPDVRGHHASAATSASSATRASRPSRCRTTATGCRADCVLGGDDGPRPRPALHPRRARGRAHQHRGPRRSAWPGPRSRRRSGTRRSARRSASRSREHQAIQFKLADMATQARGRAPAHASTRPSAKQAGERCRRRGRDGQAVRERDRVRDRHRGACASTAASATRPSCRSSATTATRR